MGVEAQLAANGLTDAPRNNKLAEAQGRYNQALRLDPRHAIATMNLAVVFAQAGLINEALLTIERAVLINPKLGTVWMNYAFMALEAERIDVAVDAAERACAVEENVQTLFARGAVSATAGYPDRALAAHNAILDLNPRDPVASINACFVQTLTPAGPAEMLKQRQRWYVANRYEGAIPRHTNSRTTDRPLRVGYVGGDFKGHSASFIFGRVLLHHSPAVEMYLYSSLPVDPNADAMTKQFQDAAGNRWRDISATNDEDAAALIRRDQIDILVDLAAHTNGGRLTLFTRRPAPVQVTAWGFAHGTGCPEIDYFFADPVAVLPEERQHFAEKIWDLPCIVTVNDIQNYGQAYKLNATSSPPLARNGFVTFGCYARYEKMSDACILTIGDILKAVPDSRVQFKDAAYRRPYSMRRIMGLLSDIEPERLLFSGATSHPDHLLAYQQADICLDPWPHGGGVVALETLYMGVPLMTRYGPNPGGRSAAAVLTGMGRTDWIGRGPADFVDRVVEWAGRPRDLAAARKTLRDELLKSPVVDGYAAAVEAAYSGMWREWCSR